MGKIAWAGVGWPGLLGVVTGINAEGLVVIVHPVRTRDVRPTRTARPIAVLARDVLENAHDLDEAIKLIETTATLGAAAYVDVDGQHGTWAVVERSPSRVAVSSVTLWLKRNPNSSIPRRMSRKTVTTMANSTSP